MDLVFITEGIDYTVADFYNHFHTQLPLVVQVSEGVMEYMGDNKEYNFVEGEVTLFVQLFSLLLKQHFFFIFFQIFKFSKKERKERKKGGE